MWEKSDEAQTSLMRLIIWLVKVTFPVIIHISHSVKQHLLQMDSHRLDGQFVQSQQSLWRRLHVEQVFITPEVQV